MEKSNKASNPAIQAIREHRKYGDVKRISEKLNVSKQFVSQCVSDHFPDVYNDKVFLEWLSIIEKRKPKEESIKNRIAKKVKALKAA